MSNPVWVLSVDLQAKTATFQSGMADAARSARGAFSDIGGGAREAGGATAFSMMEARHSVMMLGEEFGIKMPRAISGFIAGIGPLGPALEAAFPFLAIIGLAGLLIDHLTKLREAGEKLTTDQSKFLTTVNDVWGGLDKKILLAQIHADELSNNHLAALRHQLQLIDKETLDDLRHSFEQVAQAAEPVLQGLEGHWYTFSQGSTGAKHALSDFSAQYALLLSQGKDKEAGDLLKGTRESAEQSLESLKKAAAESQALQTAMPAGGPLGGGLLNIVSAMHSARLKGIHDELSAQQELLSVLNGQMGSEERIAKLKELEAGNAKKQTSNEFSAQASTAAKAHAQSQAKIGQDALAADKATAEAGLDIRHASLEERLQLDLTYAAKERDAQLEANAAQIAALDKSGKDYSNQLKALNDKSLEIQADYNAKVAEARAHSSVEIAARDLQALQTSEREKIEATQQGTSARLSAIDAAMKEEEARGLQLTDFYRQLQTQRVQAEREAGLEAGKLAEESGKQEAEAFLKAGELVIAAQRQKTQLLESLSHVSAARQVADAEHDANMVRIPVMWALDTGDVGSRRSEATLVAFYSSEACPHESRKG